MTHAPGFSPYTAEAMPYNEHATGEVAAALTATQLPNVPCRLVRIKARSDNANSLYLGGAAVTTPNDATDTTTGFELAPGEETGWIPADNLNRFYLIGLATTDALTYLALR